MSAPVEIQHKILVVDDEPDNLEMFVKEFKKKFVLLSASSAKEALAILSKEKNIGVVVTDQRMDEMSGVELLEAIKSLSPLTTRVLITGYTDINAAVDAINRGDVYRYIQKPFEKEKTLEILSDALGKYSEGLQIREAVEDVKKKIKDRFIEIYESIAAGIAHHINNGLVPTKTFYDLLPRKLKAMKEGNYDSEFFGNFLNQAVQDMLSVQKIVEMFVWVRNCKVEDFFEHKVSDLIQLNGFGIEEVLQGRKIEIQKEIDPSLPPVIVDRLKTQEMITLLIKIVPKKLWKERASRSKPKKPTARYE